MRTVGPAPIYMYCLVVKGSGRDWFIGCQRKVEES